MEFEQLVYSRKSCRNYKPDPVPKDVILKLLDMARHAPSSCNRQLWKFIVLEREFFKKNLAKSCPSIDAIGSPVVIFVLYDAQYNPEHNANVQAAAAATMTLLYAAHNTGLGALWMAGIGDEQAIRRVCNISKEFLVCCAVCIGYKDEDILEATRRPLQDVVHFGPIQQTHILPRSWNPEDWTVEQQANNLNYTVHAKAPSPKFYQPYLLPEFEAELAAIPKCVGAVLYFNPFAGNYLFPLIKDGRLPRDVRVFGISKRNNEFLEHKRRTMRLDGAIDWRDGTSALPYPDATFDHVLCINQIEKFSMSQQKSFISEFKRILKKGGVLHLMYANKNSPYWIAWKWQNWRGKVLPGLRGPYKPVGLAGLKLEGFAKAHDSGICLFPKGKHRQKTTTGWLRRFYKSTYLRLRKA